MLNLAAINQPEPTAKVNRSCQLGTSLTLASNALVSNTVFAFSIGEAIEMTAKIPKTPNKELECMFLLLRGSELAIV